LWICEAGLRILRKLEVIPSFNKITQGYIYAVILEFSKVKFRDAEA
ncbi:hypothetical protein T08_2396, partial [Trichinella sp. T8]